MPPLTRSSRRSASAAGIGSPPRRTRPRLFLPLYVVALALIVLLVPEMMVRILGIAPSAAPAVRGYVKDPSIGYKPRPNSVYSGRSASGEFNCQHAHNHLGFRDVEHSETKPPDVFRILGLGDSFTYGVGAPFEQTYLFQLEERLNARTGVHPKVEIIKEGIPKFFPHAERLTLEHYGLRFSPDLVLVGFLPNDISDTAQGLDSVEITKDGIMVTQKAASLGTMGRWLFMHSHAARIVLRRYVAWLMQRRYPIFREDIYKADGRHEADWRKAEEELARIAELCSRSGATFVLLYIPQSIPPFDDAAAAYPPARLANWARANGAYFIDTLPAFRSAEGSDRLHWPRDGHCTPAGYGVIAETVCEELLRHGLVP